jgi:hypothetical protein
VPAKGEKKSYVFVIFTKDKAFERAVNDKTFELKGETFVLKDFSAGKSDTKEKNIEKNNEQKVEKTEKKEKVEKNVEKVKEKKSMNGLGKSGEKGEDEKNKMIPFPGECTSCRMRYINTEALDMHRRAVHAL